MADQDMQAVLGVTCYQGRWALTLDGVGDLGPHCSWREDCLGSWAPDSLLLQYVWGRWAPQHTFPKFCLFVTKESWFLCYNKYPMKEVKKTIIAF